MRVFSIYYVGMQYPIKWVYQHTYELIGLAKQTQLPPMLN